MVSIDNFERIKEIWNLTDNSFYVVHIMTRNKDHNIDKPEKHQKHRIIKEYYVESLEYLERKYSEIKNLCHFFNARAYINLNRIDKSKLGLEIMSQCLNKLKSGDSNFLNILSKSIGNTTTDYRVWVIDLDCDIPSGISEILYNLEPLGEKTLSLLPTKNGYHILTKPFNLKRFNEIYSANPLISVHKNNPTLLYYNYA